MLDLMVCGSKGAGTRFKPRAEEERKRLAIERRTSFTIIIAIGKR